MSISKVALAGAGGNVGAPILKELIAAGFKVTVLTRSDSKSTFPSAAQVAKVDYESESSLKDALKGQDALISTITTGGVGAQHKLIDAAISAGVKRIIPSEFGSDTLNPDNRKLPVFGQKIAVQQQLEEKTKGTQTTYTYFINNAFLDWGIKHAFLINAKDKQIDLYDGGKTEYSATTLEGVAKGVVGVLKHPDETANRAVYVSSAVISQQKLLDLGKKALGADGWKTTEPSTAEAVKSAYEVLQKDPSNVGAWVYGFLKRSIFAAEHKPKFVKNDNELLGVSQTSDEELEKWIKEAGQS